MITRRRRFLYNTVCDILDRYGRAILGEAMHHLPPAQQIMAGAAINEMLFGERIEVADALGVTFHTKLDSYCICLTGIPKHIYEQRLGKNLDDFFTLYAAFHSEVLPRLAAAGINADVAVVKYDQSKRICLVMEGCSEQTGGADEQSLTAEDTARLIHETMARLYLTLWHPDGNAFPFVTALSPSLHGPTMLNPAFIEACRLAELAFFLDSPRLIVGGDPLFQARAVEAGQISSCLRLIERSVASADKRAIQTHLEDLFFATVRPSFNPVAVTRSIDGIRQLAERYNSVFLAAIDPERIAAFDLANFMQLQEVYEEARALLFFCADAATGKGLGLGPISLDAVRYLMAHYRSSPTVQQMAEHIGVSPTHLSRVFNREVGESIPSYLTRIRVRRAALLLDTTDASVSEIAERMGFGSAQYFASVFKQQTGRTPQQWRQRPR